MKEESLQKPPPLLLPPTKIQSNLHPKHSLFKNKEKLLDQRDVHKYTPKYDMFHGILKRVSDMKLNGSLDSEEPSTESESSAWKRDLDSRSTGSGFEDESSVSSAAGSDLWPAFEETRSNERSDGNKRGSSLPPPPPTPEDNFSSFRNSFPPPPSPNSLYSDDPCLVVRLKNSSSEYKSNESSEKEYNSKVQRPISLLEDRGSKFSRQFSCSDVNENRTKLYQKRLSLEEMGLAEGIVDSEKHQIDVFFRSLKTDVFICGSLANLYFGWKGSEGSWTFRHTGVIVVILDYGDTRSRRKRKIQIVLAERGTCFPLWKDTIDNLSEYHKSGSAFHTMHLSSDHRQIVGFSFDSPSEAEKLLKHIEELTSNPENINISVPGSRKKNKNSSKKKPAPLPHKKHISNPCLFQHVTSVAARDKPIYMSLQTLIDNDVIKKKENIS